MIPVVDPNHRVLGVITDKNIREVPQEQRGKVSVSASIESQFTHCKPNDDLYAALRSMILADSGSLPVVSSEESMRLVGIVARGDIGHLITKTEPDVHSTRAPTRTVE